MKIKIIAKGYASFSGLFGQVEFKDSVSIDHVSKMEASRLGSIIEIAEVDELGETVRSVGVGHDDVNNRSNAAETLVPAQLAEEVDAKVKQQEEPKLESIVKPNPTLENEPKIYSEAELEVIADSEGISGLRSISESLDVKAPSISLLIAKILAAQGK
jgi:hypothetical protein